MARADYLYCTDRGVELVAWATAAYPTDDGDTYEIPVEAGEIWDQSVCYPLKPDGVDARGLPQFIIDPDRTDFLMLCLIHDEQLVSELSALDTVTLHRGATVQEIAAMYPDHAAYGNVIAHL